MSLQAESTIDSNSPHSPDGSSADPQDSPSKQPFRTNSVFVRHTRRGIKQVREHSTKMQNLKIDYISIIVLINEIFTAEDRVDGNQLKRLLDLIKELNEKSANLRGTFIYPILALTEWMHKRNLLDINTQSPQERVAIAKCHLDMWRKQGVTCDFQHLQCAKEIFISHFQANPSWSVAKDWLEYFRVQMFTGDLESALSTIAFIVKEFTDDPELPTYLFYAGAAAKSLKEHDKANGYFFDALQHGPPKFLSKIEMMTIISRNLEEMGGEGGNNIHDDNGEDAYHMVHQHLILEGYLPPESDYDDWICDASTWFPLADKCALHEMYFIATDFYGLGIMRDSEAFHKPQMWFRYAKACHRCGRIADAQLALKQAMTRHPKSTQLRRAQRHWSSESERPSKPLPDDLKVILKPVLAKLQNGDESLLKLQAIIRGSIERHSLKLGFASSGLRHHKEIRSHLSAKVGAVFVNKSYNATLPVILSLKPSWSGRITYIRIFDVLSGSTGSLKLKRPFAPLRGERGPRKLVLSIIQVYDDEEGESGEQQGGQQAQEVVTLAIKFTDIETGAYSLREIRLRLLVVFDENNRLQYSIEEVSMVEHMMLPPAGVVPASSNAARINTDYGQYHDDDYDIMTTEVFDTDNVSLTSASLVYVPATEPAAIVRTNVPSCILLRESLRWREHLYLIRVVNEAEVTHISMLQVRTNRMFVLLTLREHVDRDQHLKKRWKRIMMVMEHNPRLLALLTTDEVIGGGGPMTQKMSPSLHPLDTHSVTSSITHDLPQEDSLDISSYNNNNDENSLLEAEDQFDEFTFKAYELRCQVKLIPHQQGATIIMVSDDHQPILGTAFEELEGLEFDSYDDANSEAEDQASIDRKRFLSVIPEEDSTHASINKDSGMMSQDASVTEPFPAIITVPLTEIEAAPSTGGKAKQPIDDNSESNTDNVFTRMSFLLNGHHVDDKAFALEEEHEQGKLEEKSDKLISPPSPQVEAKDVQEEVVNIDAFLNQVFGTALTSITHSFVLQRQEQDREIQLILEAERQRQEAIIAAQIAEELRIQLAREAHEQMFITTIHNLAEECVYETVHHSATVILSRCLAQSLLQSGTRNVITHSNAQHVTEKSLNTGLHQAKIEIIKQFHRDEMQRWAEHKENERMLAFRREEEIKAELLRQALLREQERLARIQRELEAQQAIVDEMIMLEINEQLAVVIEDEIELQLEELWEKQEKERWEQEQRELEAEAKARREKYHPQRVKSMVNIAPHAMHVNRDPTTTTALSSTSGTTGNKRQPKTFSNEDDIFLLEAQSEQQRRFLMSNTRPLSGSLVDPHSVHGVIRPKTSPEVLGLMQRQHRVPCSSVQIDTVEGLKQALGVREKGLNFDLDNEEDDLSFMQQLTSSNTTSPSAAANRKRPLTTSVVSVSTTLGLMKLPTIQQDIDEELQATSRKHALQAPPPLMTSMSTSSVASLYRSQNNSSTHAAHTAHAVAHTNNANNNSVQQILQSLQPANSTNNTIQSEFDALTRVTQLQAQARRLSIKELRTQTRLKKLKIRPAQPIPLYSYKDELYRSSLKEVQHLGYAPNTTISNDTGASGNEENAPSYRRTWVYTVHWQNVLDKFLKHHAAMSNANDETGGLISEHLSAAQLTANALDEVMLGLDWNASSTAAPAAAATKSVHSSLKKSNNNHPTNPPFTLLRKQLRILKRALHAGYSHKVTTHIGTNPDHTAKIKQELQLSSAVSRQQQKQQQEQQDAVTSSPFKPTSLNVNDEHDDNTNNIVELELLTSADLGTSLHDDFPDYLFLVAEEHRLLNTEQLICALADCHGSLGEVLARLRDPHRGLEFIAELQLVCGTLDIREIVCSYPGGEALFHHGHHGQHQSQVKDESSVYTSHVNRSMYSAGGSRQHQKELELVDATRALHLTEKQRQRDLHTLGKQAKGKCIGPLRHSFIAMTDAQEAAAKMGTERSTRQHMRLGSVFSLTVNLEDSQVRGSVQLKASSQDSTSSKIGSPSGSRSKLPAGLMILPSAVTPALRQRSALVMSRASIVPMGRSSMLSAASNDQQNETNSRRGSSAQGSRRASRSGSFSSQQQPPPQKRTSLLKNALNNNKPDKSSLGDKKGVDFETLRAEFLESFFTAEDSPDGQEKPSERPEPMQVGFHDSIITAGEGEEESLAEFNSSKKNNRRPFALTVSSPTNAMATTTTTAATFTDDSAGKDNRAKTPKTPKAGKRLPSPSGGATEGSPRKTFRITTRVLENIFDEQSAMPTAVLSRRDMLRVQQEETLLRSENIHIREEVQKRAQNAQRKMSTMVAMESITEATDAAAMMMEGVSPPQSAPAAGEDGNNNRAFLSRSKSISPKRGMTPIGRQSSLVGMTRQSS